MNELEAAKEWMARRAAQEARMLETECLRQRFWDAAARVASHVMAELFDSETFATAHDGVNEADMLLWVKQYAAFPFPHVLAWCDDYCIDSLMLRLDAVRAYARAQSQNEVPDRVMVSRYADRLQHVRDVGGIERASRLPLDVVTEFGSVFIWNPLHERRKVAESRILEEFTAMLRAAMDAHEAAYAEFAGNVPEKRDETHFLALARVQFLQEKRPVVADALGLDQQRLTNRINDLARVLDLTPWRGVRGAGHH